MKKTTVFTLIFAIVSIQISTCSSVSTNAGDCADTPSWHNGFERSNDLPGFTCQDYVDHKRCANGYVAQGSEWALGSPNNFPENNCCACGKQRSTPAATNSGDCGDTPSWHNGWSGANGGLGLTCQEYVTNGWCLNGAVVKGAEWTLGSTYKFPEKNCCVCGKQGGISVSTNAGDCGDTPSWNNGYVGAPNGLGFTCQEYVTRGWCANGAAVPGSEWTLGAQFKFPENNCCSCGKQRGG